MSLSETIWWCKGHSDASRVPYHPAIDGDWRDDNCKWEEFELHPVGTRVAGRDDLLIRREVVEAWLRMANNSEIFDLEYHLERALAAAEGEET